ncbi:MAG: hypothetical protein AAF582_00040 [Pseudomonadota bacterium]
MENLATWVAIAGLVTIFVVLFVTLWQEFFEQPPKEIEPEHQAGERLQRLINENFERNEQRMKRMGK